MRDLAQAALVRKAEAGVNARTAEVGGDQEVFALLKVGKAANYSLGLWEKSLGP